MSHELLHDARMSPGVQKVRAEGDAKGVQVHAPLFRFELNSRFCEIPFDRGDARYAVVKDPFGWQGIVGQD